MSFNYRKRTFQTPAKPENDELTPASETTATTTNNPVQNTTNDDDLQADDALALLQAKQQETIEAAKKKHMSNPIQNKSHLATLNFKSKSSSNTSNTNEQNTNSTTQNETNNEENEMNETIDHLQLLKNSVENALQIEIGKLSDSKNDQLIIKNLQNICVNFLKKSKKLIEKSEQSQKKRGVKRKQPETLKNPKDIQNEQKKKHLQLLIGQYKNEQKQWESLQKNQIVGGDMNVDNNDNENEKNKSEALSLEFHADSDADKFISTHNGVDVKQMITLVEDMVMQLDTIIPTTRDISSGVDKLSALQASLAEIVRQKGFEPYKSDPRSLIANLASKD